MRSTAPLSVGSTTVQTWWVSRVSRTVCQEVCTPLSQQRVLDRDQQVVGQHAQKDVRLHPMLEVVEDRALAERALHVAEGIFDPRQQDVEAPGLLGAQVGAIGAQQIGAVELLGALVLLGVHARSGTLAARRRRPSGSTGPRAGSVP